MRPLRVKVDLGVMARKGYSTFPKAPGLLEPHHQIALSHILDTRVWAWILTSLQRSSRCILQPQPIGNRTRVTCVCVWGGSYPFVEKQSVDSAAPETILSNRTHLNVTIIRNKIK